MANFRPDFKSLKKFLHLLKYSVQRTNVKLCLYIWRTHRQYYHLPPPPFLLHPAQTFKIMSGGKKKKKSGEATPTDSFNPQYDHFFVYVLNTKNVPCAVGIQVSTGTHLVAWLMFCSESGDTPMAVKMERGCEQCCCWELATHYEVPTELNKPQNKAFCSVLWPDPVAFFKLLLMLVLHLSE